MKRQHRKRRHRRTAKQQLKHGSNAKRRHRRVAGRSGSIRAKRLRQGSVRS